jgi:hypothetical protein
MMMVVSVYVDCFVHFNNYSAKKYNRMLKSKFHLLIFIGFFDAPMESLLKSPGFAGYIPADIVIIQIAIKRFKTL